jgi:c-di-GMP-related signal transduction protein
VNWRNAQTGNLHFLPLAAVPEFPVFGFALEIKSIRHAMAVLGEREMRRWIRLVVTVGAAEQRCSELVLMGLARARFCELLSDRLQLET